MEKKPIDKRIIFSIIRDFTKQYQELPSINILVNKTKKFNYSKSDILRVLDNIARKDIHDFYFPKIEYKKKKLKIKYLLLSWASLIMGLISSIISFMFTKIWALTYLPFPVILSSGCSLVLISASVICFSYIKPVYNNSRLTQNFYISFFKVLPLICIWIIIIGLSVSTSIAGQFDKLMDKEIKLSENESLNNNYIILYEENKKSIEQKQIDIKSARIERDKLLSFLDNINDFKSEEYKELNRTINEKDWWIDRLQKEIKKLEKENKELLRNNIKITTEKKINFYIWVSSIFKWDPSLFKFFFMCLFGVFVEITAPLGIDLFINFRKKDEEI